MRRTDNGKRIRRHPGDGQPVIPRTCDRCHKAVYGSASAAKRGAASVARRNGDRRARVYECPHHPGTWHLTHPGRSS